MTSVRTIGLAASAKKLTYKEAVLAHLDSLTPEQGEMELEIGVICAVTSEGAAFSLLKDCNYLDAIGLLETIKFIFIEESL